MKKILLDVLFGIFTIVVVTVFEFLVTMPFGEPGDLNTDGYSSFINRELLLTALPAAFTTFAFTWLLKTKTRSECLRKAIIWTIMLALYYVSIGLGNHNFLEIFRTAGVYVLLACAFAGSTIYAIIRHLK
jgi:hypothetical protein